jgi:tRNA nucleotidyltransferase (CCA-adding enzyme)
MNSLQEKLLKLLPKKAYTIIEAIKNRNGIPYLVGGAVRDLLVGALTKDIDIEVHGLGVDDLQLLLQKFGPVDLVGRSFGVLKLHGLNIDWSVPRTDAEGRKPNVMVNPNMALKDACERRDLTMNAMAINLLTNELADPFGGQKDIALKILRAPNPKKFKEDPLRFWRVFQFMARFGMQPDKELNAIAKKINLDAVSKERVSDELKKWLLKSPKPSIALDWLDQIGRLDELFPELYALKFVQQRPDYHPEGDVFEHTKQALDAAAQLEYSDDAEKLTLMLAALCHDLGKVTKTHIKEDGTISSHGHAQESAKIAKIFLERYFNDKSIMQDVRALVANHMEPLGFLSNNASSAAYKRLAQKLDPLTLKQLAQLFYVDRMGRNPKKGEPLQGIENDVEEFIKRAKAANAYHEAERALLLGKDLMPEIEPGPEMGRLLRQAYQIQVDEGITDKDELKARVLKK